jgi:hypothetical protein
LKAQFYGTRGSFLCARDVLQALPLLKSSLNLLFFLLCPGSKCLRIFLPCLRDDHVTIFVPLTLTNLALPDRAPALGIGGRRIVYDLGPVLERSNNPAQSLEERTQFVRIG